MTMQQLIYYFLTLCVMSSLSGQSTEKRMKDAQTYYQKGIQASHYQERKLAFNQALFLYESMKEEVPNSSDLNEALGNLYFELGEYPWAILYYRRALKNNLASSILSSHLIKAQQMLGLASTENQPQKKKSVFYSLSQNVTFFLGCIALTFVTASLFIWFPSPALRKLTVVCSILMTGCLVNALFFYYFPPLEGILIKSSGFYRGADLNDSQLTHQPLPAGSNVQILEMTKEGNWIKINHAGMMGYIPTDHLRAI